MQTDMNQRERRSYADKLENLADLAKEAAQSLREEDDVQVMVKVILLAFTGSGITGELIKIFQDAADVEKAKASLEDL